jgi:hypothetical protein
MHLTQEADVGPKIQSIHAPTVLESLSGIVLLSCSRSLAQIWAKELDQMRI